MKIINIILSVFILCSFVAISGCENTAHGLHADWQQNTQSAADATGN
jgi:predicted small secreted protein